MLGGGAGDLKYPLVSDLKHEIVKKYHVENEEGVGLRGLFIIDPDGVIQHATINNAPIGRNVGETLRLLQVCITFPFRTTFCAVY